MANLGILFDIDALEEEGGGPYGFEAYKLLFGATRGVCGYQFSDGDTNETLSGRANQYCIAVEADNSTIAAIREALGTSDAAGLLPAPSRFIEDYYQISREPLVFAGTIDSRGQFVDSGSGFWAKAAWDAVRKEAGDQEPVSAEPELIAVGHEPATKKWWQVWK